MKAKLCRTAVSTLLLRMVVARGGRYSSAAANLSAGTPTAAGPLAHATWTTLPSGLEASVFFLAMRSSSTPSSYCAGAAGASAEGPNRLSTVPGGRSAQAFPC